jgi:ABC-2 type transport system ATP-binding protein
MIELKCVDFNYGANRLFKNISLTLIPGKIYGLLGNNGAGKTTLLKIISGLIFPSGGECHLNGYDSRSRSPGALADIFFIPETYQLPEMKIETYIRYYSVFYPGFDRSIFDAEMTALNVDPAGSLHKLSYGQKKKFLLAFGIATQCKILIFDEPTNALDIPSQEIIRNTLKKMNRDNRLVILSTHHVREMEEVFDSILILDRGEILFQNDMERVRDQYCVELVDKIDEEAGILFSKAVPGGYSVLKKRSQADTGRLDIEFLFHAVTGRPEVFKSLANTGVTG